MDIEIDGSDEAFARKLEIDERESAEKQQKEQEQLALLISVAESDNEAKEIEETFQSDRGRKILLNGKSDEDDDQPPSNRTRNRRRGRTSRNELAELIGSDEDSRAIAESIRTNRDATDGVTTRRGTVLGRKRKIEETQSVPLKQSTIRKNFVERNRRAAYDRAIYESKSVEKPRRKPKRLMKQSDLDMPKRERRARETPNRSLRRSSRRGGKLRRNDSDEEDEHIEEEVLDESVHSDASMHSSGSGGRDDEVEPESEDENSDTSFALSDDQQTDRSEAESNEGEDDDEEDAEESEPERERIVVRVNIGNRRSSRIQGKQVRSVIAPTRAQSSKKKKPAKKKKKKKRKIRRRTNPRSVFHVEETSHDLTQQERKERLEALVKQSADVAQKLNEAMAAEKQRNEEREKERTDATAGEASPGRHMRKYEGDGVWPTAEGMQMQPHQVDGVRWMITLDSRGLNAILADEMGLGKTIQSIAFLATICLAENRGPHLIIAPKNVVPHWAAEFENFYPGKFKVLTHIGAGSERFDRLKRNMQKYPDFDVLVTSYDLAQRDLLTKPKPDNQMAWANRRTIRDMQKLEFEYAVVDEAHRLKNAESKFSVNLRKYTQAKRRLLLTGTPLSNNLQELWALMNVLNPRIFGSHAAFNEWFAAPFDTTRGGLTVSEQTLIVTRLHTILRPFFRRRLRADVCPSYSSADEVVIKCPQSALQKAMIRHYLKCRKNKQLSANNTFMILRHIANHPYVHCRALFDASELKKSNVLVGVSGKFLFLHYALPRLISGGHRVLIFSQFKKVLDFLEDLMEMLGYSYRRLDGDTDNEDRDGAVSSFNAEDSPYPIFLLTTRAGGVGLNLQTADTVILFDSDWNPSADLQAVSRIQRIGQKRVVHIMRLVTENSIDEAVVDRGREKLRTEAVAVGAGNFNANVDPTENTEVRQKELEAILSKYEGNENATEEFLNIDEGNTGDTVSNEAVSKAKFNEWSGQLLRKDEESLPENTNPPQQIELLPLSVPEWLHPGKNMKSASLALKCGSKWQIPAALERGEMYEKENNGQLPAKRARKQRFDFGSMTTDGGSDTDEYKTPDADAIIDSESSEDFIPEVDDNGNPVINLDLVPKSAIASDTSPNGPSAGPMLARLNAATNNAINAGNSTFQASMNGVPIAPVPAPRTSGTFAPKLGIIAPQTVTTVKRTNYVPPVPKRKTLPVTEPVSDKSLSPQDPTERRNSAPTCERERTLAISERANFRYVTPQLTPTGNKVGSSSNILANGGGSSSKRSNGSNKVYGAGRLGGSTTGSKNKGRKGGASGSSSTKSLARTGNSGKSLGGLGSMGRRPGNGSKNGNSNSMGSFAKGVQRPWGGSRNVSTAVKARKTPVASEVIVIEDSDDEEERKATEKKDKQRRR